MVTQERLEADWRSLRTFAFLNPDHVRVISHSPDLRHYRVRLDLDAPVATAGGYEVLPLHELAVDIPDGYLGRDRNGAFVKSRIRRDGRPVFHPNCWQNDSSLCFDSQFVPAKSLAEQVHTAILLMQCRLLNLNSPASFDVDYFYREHGDEIRSRIRQVPLRLPRSDMRLAPREAPRLLP